MMIGESFTASRSSDGETVRAASMSEMCTAVLAVDGVEVVAFGTA
jgi:hypothetical protein